MTDQWSTYWQNQVIDSCLPTRPEDADVIQGCWTEFCQYLPEQAEGIDIATGNGAVINTLLSARPDVALVGVDQARLNPPLSLKHHDKVTMVPQVRAEDLPYPANAFDFATSQFGLEYANVELALSELSRVVKARGQWQLIMHAKDSIILQSHREKSIQLTALLKPEGVMQSLTAMAQGKGNMATLEQAGHEFLNKEGRSRTGVQRQVFANINQLLERHNRGQSISDYCYQMQQRMSAECERLEDLQKAAVDEARLEQLFIRGSSQGFKVERQQSILTHDGHKIGWLVRGEVL